MADESMAFAEYIRQQGGEDFLRGVVEAVLTRLMDYEVTGQIGAGPHERSGARFTPYISSIVEHLVLCSSRRSRLYVSVVISLPHSNSKISAPYQGGITESGVRA